MLQQNLMHVKGSQNAYHSTIHWLQMIRRTDNDNLLSQAAVTQNIKLQAAYSRQNVRH